MKWGGKVEKCLPQYTSVESLIERAGKLGKKYGGTREGFVQGNVKAMFKDLARQHGAKIRLNKDDKQCKIRVQNVNK